MRILDAASKATLDLSGEREVRMYVCGPTVYNHVHLGNIRPLITFDVLHRYLKDLGKAVVYVHNITDIDDKIVRQAGIEGIPELTLSERYAKAYADVMAKLAILPMENPRVSESIPQIVAYVKRLVDAGRAYALDGSVYFDVSQAKGYGGVAHMRREELYAGEAGAELGKRHPADFALWKRTDAGIAWDSPWGRGRPGWHTECACLVDARFGGGTLTLHGGGIDLRFPHHENENAQHAALHGGAPIARSWMHVGHLNIDNQKMSKSLNNFVYASQLLERHGPFAVRWLFYQTHYRSPLDFNGESMEAAARETARLALAHNKGKSALALAGLPHELEPLRDDAFAAAVEDDLNLANAVQELWRLHKAGNDALNKRDWAALTDALSRQKWCFGILGLAFPDLHNDAGLALLREWDARVKAKEYAQADALRAKLIDRKIW